MCSSCCASQGDEEDEESAPQELQEYLYTTCKKLHMLHTMKFSHHGKEMFDGCIELYTNKKVGILQPRNQNTFALCKGTSFHVTECSLPKCKAAQPTEHSTVQSQWS